MQLDNLLLHGGAQLKMADFGFSKDTLGQSTCKSSCGTPEVCLESKSIQVTRLGGELVLQCTCESRGSMADPHAAKVCQQNPMRSLAHFYVIVTSWLQYIAPELLFSGKYDGTRADTWCVSQQPLVLRFVLKTRRLHHVLSMITQQ